MRTRFVVAPSRKEAWKLAPWAAVIIEVDGGYRCFESVTDANTWRRQK